MSEDKSQISDDVIDIEDVVYCIASIKRLHVVDESYDDTSLEARAQKASAVHNQYAILTIDLRNMTHSFYRPVGGEAEICLIILPADKKLDELLSSELEKLDDKTLINCLVKLSARDELREKSFLLLESKLSDQMSSDLKEIAMQGLYDIAVQYSSFAKRAIDSFAKLDLNLPENENAAGFIYYLASAYKHSPEKIPDYAINALSHGKTAFAVDIVSCIAEIAPNSRTAAMSALEEIATPDSVAALAKMVGDDWDRAIETLPVLMRLSDKFNEKADQEAVVTSLKSVMNIAINPSKLAPAIYDYSTAAIDKLKSEFMAAGNRAEPHPFIINVIFSSVLEANDFRKRASLADQQAAQIFGFGLEK